MIDAAGAGCLTIEKLEAMTCVCSVGLDMIAIPGDTTAATISGIIADEAAIGMVNQKTTAVRIIPVYGKGVGDSAEFGGLMGYAPIMPVNQTSCEAFVTRGWPHPPRRSTASRTSRQRRRLPPIQGGAVHNRCPAPSNEGGCVVIDVFPSPDGAAGEADCFSLLAALEVQLTPGLIDRNRGAVRQVQATQARAHRQTDLLGHMRAEHDVHRIRDVARLRAEQQDVGRLVFDLGITVWWHAQ